MFEEQQMGVEAPEVATQEPAEVTTEVADGIETGEEAGAEAEETPAAGGIEENDRVETAFAKRLAQERAKLERELQQKYEKHMQHLQDIASYYGYDSLDEYFSAIEQQKLEEEAQSRGVDPGFYRQFMQMQQELSQYKRQSTFAQQDNVLRGEPFYTDWRDEVYGLAEQLDTDLETAYTIILRQRIKDVLETSKRQGEQSAIKNMVNRDRASVGPISGGAPNIKTDFWKMSDTEFKEMLNKAKMGLLKNI